MKKEVLYTVPSYFRDDMKILSYRFGKGEKSCVILGALRGDEVQQLYVCARLVSFLRDVEKEGGILPGRTVTVIPTALGASMNVGTRLWAPENTDINRSFPGDPAGSTAERIADGLFSALKLYRYGIQLTSFYQPGSFVPHVRVMDTGRQNPELGCEFGLPYVYVREPRITDRITLNYAWQLSGTQAFSLYAGDMPGGILAADDAAGVEEADDGSQRLLRGGFVDFVRLSRVQGVRLRTGELPRVIEGRPVRDAGLPDVDIRKAEFTAEFRVLPARIHDADMRDEGTGLIKTGELDAVPVKLQRGEEPVRDALRRAACGVAGEAAVDVHVFRRPKAGPHVHGGADGRRDDGNGPPGEDAAVLFHVPQEGYQPGTDVQLLDLVAAQGAQDDAALFAFPEAVGEDLHIIPEVRRDGVQDFFFHTGSFRMRAISVPG